MDRLTILVGRPNKSVAPTKYLFKVPQVDRFIPLVSVICWPVESPLQSDVTHFVFIRTNLGLVIKYGDGEGGATKW